MKNWNKPEIEEINVTLTMGGEKVNISEATQDPYGIGFKDYYIGSN